MATDPWAAFNPQPAASGPIVAPSDPFQISAEQRAQAGEVRAQQDQSLTTQLAEITIAERQEKLLERERQQQAMATGVEDSKAQIRNVINAAQQARAKSNEFLATGFGADTAKGFGGTAASDVAALLNTIGANTAFDRLQAMREESPTGGALGAVSEIELQLLRDSIASIAQSQSDEQFQANMTQVERAYQRVLDRLEGRDPDAPLDPEGEGLTGVRVTDDSPGLTGATSDTTPSPYDPGPGSLRNIATALGQGAGSVVEGVAALPGMVINPIGQALYDALGYDQQYDTGTIVREAIGLPDNPNQFNDSVIQGGAAALTGGLGARAASTITQPGVAQNALNIIGRTPIRDTAAGAGAGAGMVAGRESGLPGGEVVGALAGGLAGYGGANALAGLGAQRGPTSLYQAAQRQNVDLLPADAGGPVARAVTTGARASPLSLGPVASAAQSQQGQMAAATRRIAETQGARTDTDIAGQGVRAAAERYTRRTSERASRLYERAGESSQGVRIKPLQTMAKLDDYIARVQQNPAASATDLDSLVRFRQNIEGGTGVTGLRDARTALSQGVYNGQLRSGAEQAMWKDILSDLSTDIDAGLREAGRTDAANQFRRADEFWKGRVEHIDQVLQPILGRDRSGEQIVSSIESMARGQGGGNARLSRLLSEMTPEESGQIRATIIDRLGRANPGAQDAEGTAYSASTFLTNWNKMTPQAKASLFNNTQLRRDLNDIATLADGMKQSQAMANTSNTGVAIGGNAAVGGALAVTNPTALLAGAGASYLTGKLMASPAFARLLARTAKLPAERANRTFTEQLGILAGREPVLANDIRSVQQFLSEAASQSPGRLAAQDDELNRRPEPPQ